MTLRFVKPRSPTNKPSLLLRLVLLLLRLFLRRQFPQQPPQHFLRVHAHPLAHAVFGGAVVDVHVGAFVDDRAFIGLERDVGAGFDQVVFRNFLLHPLKENLRRFAFPFHLQNVHQRHQRDVVAHALDSLLFVFAVPLFELLFPVGELFFAVFAVADAVEVGEEGKRHTVVVVAFFVGDRVDLSFGEFLPRLVVFALLRNRRGRFFGFVGFRGRRRGFVGVGFGCVGFRWFGFWLFFNAAHLWGAKHPYE